MRTIERVIITALLRDMRAEGYQAAAVWDGEKYIMGATHHSTLSFDRSNAPEHITRSLTDEEVLEAIDSVDECTLHFTHRNKTTWGNRGVLLILGNGEDIISDHHSHDTEPFNTIVSDICERVSNGVVP